ncbi:LPS assembly lipoprotein LptE [Inmirania thermothiophila]|uniref:LPS-assembly lipoprotein LptE n=1 Tax=Inmirania thermothiophila TaxID=1750597 RepID=A0A3N1Y7T3_9GAMM|nr:LPS assembly lipoprotein LptE [Inmirania thermothiophila]ROR34863.1 LPS-assembly lipoprotein [Inmirania thermothiophila]
MGGALRVLALLAAAALAGCGFHLRGSMDLPPPLARAVVTGEAVPVELEEALGRALRAAGGVLAAAPETARARIVVLEVRNERRVLAVGSDGKAREYELRYAVRYRIDAADGRPLLAPQQVAVTRDLVFDTGDFLAKRDEEATVHAEMVREAAAALLRRAAAALR